MSLARLPPRRPALPRFLPSWELSAGTPSGWVSPWLAGHEGTRPYLVPALSSQVVGTGGRAGAGRAPPAVRYAPAIASVGVAVIGAPGA